MFSSSMGRGESSKICLAPNQYLGGTGLNPFEALIFSAIAQGTDYLRKLFLCFIFIRRSNEI